MPDIEAIPVLPDCAKDALQALVVVKADEMTIDKMLPITSKPIIIRWLKFTFVFIFKNLIF